MTVEWPVVDDRVKALFRQGAELALMQPDEVLTAMTEATLGGITSVTAALDPDLARAAARANAANLRQWAAANAERPAERVRAELSDDALLLTRDLVRRGLETFAVDAFRASQSASWRMWMFSCFALTSDVRELHQLLDVSAVSISTYIGDLQAATMRFIEEERDDLTRGSHAERLTTVTQLLEGIPVPRERAERRLGYGLLGAHTAVVLWSDEADESRTTATDLAAASDEVVRASGATKRLVVRPSDTSWWIWVPTAFDTDRARLTDLAAALAPWPGVRVATGRAARGVDGFRTSHADAVVAQRLAARGAGGRVTSFDDVHLLHLLEGDPRRADDFVLSTLGRFANASDDDRTTVLTWIRHQCNSTSTAAALFTHRNSVLRRLARADEQLPGALADRVLEVGVALELLRLRQRGDGPF